MNKKIIVPLLGAGLALSVFFPGIQAVAQDATSSENIQTPEVFVSADRVPYPKAQVASSVTVITRDDIEASQKQTVSDVLKGVPGLDVVQSGSLGGNVSVFIRGANAEHTLVIVDGIESNDPISPTRTFDFANFSIDNIERIEIIRGPQSVLYGSDAIGGVILITTRRGQGAPSGWVSAEGGSFGSFTERAAISGGDDLSSFSLAVSQNNRDGFSTADKRDGNAERDGYAGTNVSTLFTLTPSDMVEGSLAVRYSNARTELDNFGGAGGDDPNRVLLDNQVLSRAQVKTKFFDGRLKQVYGLSFTNHWYDDNNPVDPDHPVDSFESNYTGKEKKFDFQNQVKVSDAVDIIAGYENETDQGSSSYVSQSAFGPYSDILNDTSVTTNGYYLQGRWNYSDTLITTAGGRIDDHSVFGSQSTWRAGPTLLLGDTKLSGTVGTGYKAPSIFQLYSSFGNKDLQPEESFGWDVGVEQSFFSKDATVGVTYFNNDFDDLITFNPSTFVSENIAQARSSGIEIYGSVKLLKDIFFDGSYTYTDTEDKATGQQLLRRARNKGRAALRYQATSKSELGVELLVNGRRLDNDFSTFPASSTDLGGYVLLNLTARYHLTDRLELFGRADNILDQRYQEVLGYGTAGASVFGGLKYNL